MERDLCGHWANSSMSGERSRGCAGRDLVVVAGAGVLENSLPMRATGVPYAMFLLCASGRLARTKVALLSVGATTIQPRPTRGCETALAPRPLSLLPRQTLLGRNAAVRELSRNDPVYTDLVFSLPAPYSAVGDQRLVGVGIMSFFGGSDDRRDGQQIHDAYIDAMTQFVCWLLDHGFGVRLLSGDDSKDDPVIASVIADVLARRPTWRRERSWRIPLRPWVTSSGRSSQWAPS